MQDRTLLALCLAATMVLAGCANVPGASQPTESADESVTTSRPAATESPPTARETTTASSTTRAGDGTESDAGPDCVHRREDDDDVVEEAGVCLGFDADRVYRNVLEMTGDTDLERGPFLQSLSPDETLAYSASALGLRNESFQATMGIEPNGTPDVYVAGFARPPSHADGDVSVVLRYVANQSSDAPSPGRVQNASEAEVTLAHEFLHAVQFQRGYIERLRRNLSRADVQFNHGDVELALVEGSAVYFESRYQERYMGRESASRSFERWANASPFTMYALGPYVLGERYTAFRVNSTTEFESIYDDPAVSTEQIIHRYEPDEELPRELSVQAEATSDWARPSFPKTKGELFLRAALRSGVDGSDAARGAAGWGQDGVVTFQNATYSRSGVYKFGYAWAIRFDNASEAEEFETIFQEWLASKGPEEDGVYAASDDRTYRLVSVSEETVVVLAGHEAFTTRATVAGNTTHVVVEHTDATQVGANETGANEGGADEGGANWSRANEGGANGSGADEGGANGSRADEGGAISRSAGPTAADRPRGTSTDAWSAVSSPSEPDATIRPVAHRG